MTEENEKSNEVVVQLPISLLGLIAQTAGADGAFNKLDSPWGVVYSEGASGSSDKLYMADGFSDREGLAVWLENNYNDEGVEVLAVLKNGKPRNFKMEVKARFR